MTKLVSDKEMGEGNTQEDVDLKFNQTLKGKGGIGECPACKSTDISATDREFIGYKEMIQDVECNNCGKSFKETWKAIAWEEV